MTPRLSRKAAIRKWIPALVIASLPHCLSASASAVEQADTPVKSVSITVAMRPNPTPTFIIVNNYRAAIEAFTIAVAVLRMPMPLTYEADMSRTVQTPPDDHGPIPPGGRRVVEYNPRVDLSTAKVSLSVLVFADGHAEGSVDALHKLFDDRAVLARDLAYWKRVLEAVPDSTNDGLTAYLRQKDAEHQVDTPADPSKVRAGVRSLLAVKRAPGGLIGAVETLRDRTALRLTIATRHLHPPSEAMPVPRDRMSAEVSIGSDGFLDAVATIENRSSVALEAWRVVPTTLTGKLPDIQYDRCLSPDPPAGRSNTTGRVPPGGQLEWVIFQGHMLPTGTNVSATLSMVMFSDLSFEGSVKDRDAVYRARERQAAERAFWIDALTEALAQPSTALERLEPKLEASQRRGDVLATSMASNLANLEKLVDADFRTRMLTRFRDDFARERASLLRHQTGSGRKN